MIIIRFSEKGVPVSDFEISDRVDKLMEHVGDISFHTSTHLIIDELRARINEGKIGADEVKIFVRNNFGMIEKTFDKNGRSNNWYPSECVQDGILTRLLRPNIMSS